MEASKWIAHRILLTVSELKELFDFLEPIKLYNISQVLSSPEFEIPIPEFIDKYALYLKRLENRDKNPTKDLRHYFSCAMSQSENDFELKEINNKFMAKMISPAIQLRAHSYIITDDDRIVSMATGSTSVSYGLQFSYPQLFRHPKTHEMVNVYNNSDYPNGDCFRKLASWVRKHTRPVKLTINDKVVIAPFRQGLLKCT